MADYGGVNDNDNVNANVNDNVNANVNVNVNENTEPINVLAQIAKGLRK